VSRLTEKENFTIHPAAEADEDEDLGVLPLDPAVVEVRHQAMLERLPPPVEPDPPKPPFKLQFTIRQLLGLTAILSVLLAITRLGPAGVVAVVLSLPAIFMLPYIPEASEATKKIWITILILYALTCITAMVRG
jgi:hypothetical protein